MKPKILADADIKLKTNIAKQEIDDMPKIKSKPKLVKNIGIIIHSP